ncbi:hypothetical protein ACJJTC_006297 [Scirpophaga incertulas]
MHYSCQKRIIYCVLAIIVLFILLHPNLNARRTYEFIDKADIPVNLYVKISENFTSSALIQCDYHDVLYDDTSLSISIIDEDFSEGHKIKDGGEYCPTDCKPKFSSAIIVPYRDRAEQLRGFLVYMHMFLQQQNIHYRIYIIEQVDSNPFNRAKLLNIGALTAIRAGYPCLIFHDVDLLPLKPANLYACTKCPRHLSSSINKFRFVLPYLNLYGGAIAMTTEQYKLINGMSNRYYGWGGEDDDLYARLEIAKLKLCRFEPQTSKYHMLPHKTHPKRLRRQHLLKFARTRIHKDGLNSLQYTEVATVLHPLFTHIMVDL